MAKEEYVVAQTDNSHLQVELNEMSKLGYELVTVYPIGSDRVYYVVRAKTKE